MIPKLFGLNTPNSKSIVDLNRLIALDREDELLLRIRLEGDIFYALEFSDEESRNECSDQIIRIWRSDPDVESFKRLLEGED